MSRFIIIFLIAAAGFAGGAMLTARHYEPQLAEANREIGEFEHAYLTLATAVSHQNDAINTLHDEGERRKATAIAAAKQARGEAQTYYAKSLAILGLRPPPGADPCHVARDAFDEELRAERGPR